MSVETKVMGIMLEMACLNRDDAARVNLASDVTHQLGMDSLDVIEVTMALEDAFNIEIHDDELENLETIQDFVDIIGKLAEEKDG